MRIRPVVWGGARAIIPLVWLVIAFAAAYYLTGWLYLRLGWHPPLVFVQIINSVLGMMLVVLAVIVFGLFFRPGPRGLFTPIIRTLDRIAKGDFSARLEMRHQKHGPVGELVQTVNHMALKLDQMEKMRQEFISDVSHEIQSPLTSIRGFACALQQNDLSLEERRHYLEIIEAESARLSKLGANLLKLATLESDQVKFQPKPYRLDTQIRSLILANEPQWAAKRLAVEATLDEAGITADEDLLSQVWSNLIHNSIKFTPEGGGVRVSLQRRGNRLQVTVADTGVGIALEDQPHIFERFYKADKARGRSEGGNGLGLSIAKKAVELHHGSIAVHSQPGSGAAFTVELPIEQ